MWKWLRRPISRGAEPVLQGVPIRPRIKTFSAASGRVYRYVYRGARTIEEPATTEHVFEMSVHGQSPLLVRIHLAEPEIAEAERLIGRPILNSERYAIAKLTLFSLLDEAANLEAACSTPVASTAVLMRDHLAALGRI